MIIFGAAIPWAAAAFIVNAIASDGETTWFEGVLLMGVYLLLGLTFPYVG